MNREQILDCLQELAQSQGFYGRLLRDMSEEFLSELEAQKFGDMLDLVLYIES